MYQTNVTFTNFIKHQVSLYYEEHIIMNQLLSYVAERWIIFN